MELPINPEYRPVIEAKDYHKIDGKSVSEANLLNEELKALSLGLTPAKDDQPADIAAKLWQAKAGESWQAASSEIPLTRILDLAILATRTSLYFQDAYRFPKFYDPENPNIDIIGLQGNRMTVDIDTDNPEIDQDVLAFHDMLQKDGELLGQRFRELKRLLEEAGY